MRTGVRDDNKGFSLIELLVILAIMALMLGLFLLSTNILGTRACRQCTKQIRHELDRVRIATMGKNKVVLHLYVDPSSGKIMVQDETKLANIGATTGTHDVSGDAREIGSARVRVEFISSLDPANRVTLNNDGIYFEFNRSTGAFKQVKSSDVGGQLSGDYTIKNIYVIGGGLEESLTLSGITGKVTEN